MMKNSLQLVYVTQFEHIVKIYEFWTKKHVNSDKMVIILIFNETHNETKVLGVLFFGEIQRVLMSQFIFDMCPNFLHCSFVQNFDCLFLFDRLHLEHLCTFQTANELCYQLQVIQMSTIPNMF